MYGVPKHGSILCAKVLILSHTSDIFMVFAGLLQPIGEHFLNLKKSLTSIAVLCYTKKRKSFF